MSLFFQGKMIRPSLVPMGVKEYVIHALMICLPPDNFYLKGNKVILLYFQFLVAIMLTVPQSLAAVGANKTRVGKKAASKYLKLSVNARNLNIAILKEFVSNQVL